MMKLSIMKDIFKTVNKDWDCDLAKELAIHWEHDKDWVKMWRVSANCVCYLRNKNKNYVIRFNKNSERKYEEIETELVLMKYLKKNNILVPELILSKNNKYIETTKTKYGVFYSSVFERIIGTQKEIDGLEDGDFTTWGKELGKIHKATKQLPFNIMRKSHKELFYELILECPCKNEIEKKEKIELEKWINGLTINKSNYGLIHYDFELDNMLWTDKGLYIIDFDDAIYSWYVADIAYALRDLFDQGREFNPDNEMFKKFMAGYKSETDITDEELELLPGFYRFHNFISYKKLMKSIDVPFSGNNPEWLKTLIEKIIVIKNSCYENFGEKLCQ